MILPLHDALRRRVAALIAEIYGLAPDALPALAVSYAPTRALGDLALPVAFELARRVRRAPRAIAQELAARFGALPGVSRVEPTAAGYLNVFLDRAALLRASLDAQQADEEARERRRKTIVEHTAINPNKAAHVGHLRNAVLGDALVRVLRFRGAPVEVQNYIDDTGVQVADVVVGFQEIERRTLDDVRRIADETRFDYYCWDLYARVTDWYEGDKSRLEARSAALHAIEHGEAPAAPMAAFIADRIVRRHLETMARLNIGYDLLTWEGDILQLQFWARMFDILRAKGVLYRQDSGRLAGCWVMRIDEDGDAQADGDDEEQETREKVVVRSNGVVTYVGKDLANQFWKLGLLGRDFHYRVFARRADGRALYATTARADDHDPSAPAFGGASVIYNVIDVRQMYQQKLLKQALTAMGHREEADHSIHYAYEVVALSLSTARQLGFAVEEAGRPFVEVSGRKGLGVKADDFIDALAAKAETEVATRNPDMPAEERRRTAEAIAVAAVRYFLIKFTRTKLIVFDMDEALSFEGESGPYLQYAAVRAANILAKLQERDGVDEAMLIDAARNLAGLEGGEEADEVWNLVLQTARLDEIAEQAIASLELAVLAKHAFGLAQTFSAFYHRAPVLSEPDPAIKLRRAAAVLFFRNQMTRTLDLMGIATPSRM
jgi:arginyl-tRNA synthetase